MASKRAPQVVFSMNVEEQRRLVQVVALLAAVARRTGVSRQKKSKIGKPKKHKQVRRIRGPCFFNRTFYHGVIDFAFTQSDYHDRYPNTNIAQRHVPDN